MMNFGFLVFVIVCIQPNARAQNSKGRSCSAILAKDSSASSGTYTIDPDGLGRGEEYEVYCDMSRNGGVTVIGHDSENRTHVANFNEPGSYGRIVNYSSTSLPQIIRLRSISIECTQYIEYDCKHSRLKEFAWWLNPDGDARTYWGTGSTRGDDICACSLTSNCPRADLTCNCDANDHIWREDKGTLSFKADLPVVELRFGDTKNDPPDIEEAYHILGPLECFGQQDIDDCDTNPCKNGGTCVDRENDFECICNAGYGNVLCQTDLDDCDPNPCVNGGNCTDKLDDFECECTPEFEGKMCRSAIVSDGESECGSYCLLIILLSICIAIGVGSVAVIIAIAFIAS